MIVMMKDTQRNAKVCSYQCFRSRLQPLFDISNLHRAFMVRLRRMICFYFLWNFDLSLYEKVSSACWRRQCLRTWAENIQMIQVDDKYKSRKFTNKEINNERNEPTGNKWIMSELMNEQMNARASECVSAWVRERVGAWVGVRES